LPYMTDDPAAIEIKIWPGCKARRWWTLNGS